jgi:hypothetical protein
LSGQQVVLLMNADLGPYSLHQKYTALHVCQRRKVNLHIKRSTQCDTMGKISDTQVAHCRSNDHLMRLIQENVADLHGVGRVP